MTQSREKEAGPEQRDESFKEDCLACLQESRQYSENSFDADWKWSLEKKNSADWMPKDIDELTHIAERLRKLSAILDKIVNEIKTSPRYLVIDGDKIALREFVGHDLGNYLITRLTTFVAEARKNLSAGKFKRAYDKITIALNAWPRLSFILEDIILRYLDPLKIDSKQFRTFNYNHAKLSLDDLYDRMDEKIEGKRQKQRQEVRYKLQEHPAGEMIYPSNEAKDVGDHLEPMRPVEFSELPEDGESVFVNPGVIVNALNNVIRNGCTEYVDSRHVNTEFHRVSRGGASFLLAEVTDDGMGMSATYLDPQNKDFIFRFGRSHRGSSGYGLTSMQDRLSSMNVGLSVTSHMRETDDRAENHYDNFDNLRDMDSDLLREIDRQKNDKNFSTIFRFFIPILKKG